MVEEVVVLIGKAEVPICARGHHVSKVEILRVSIGDKVLHDLTGKVPIAAKRVGTRANVKAPGGAPELVPLGVGREGPAENPSRDVFVQFASGWHSVNLLQARKVQSGFLSSATRAEGLGIFARNR